MLLWLLVLGTIPAGIAGLALQKQADSTLRTLPIIGASAILIGIFMWWADRAGRGQKDTGPRFLGGFSAVGFAQVLAVIPGVSRSGITISAGLLRNLDRPTAARFSFLLSTPIILGAALKDAWDLLKHKEAVPHEMQIAFVLGILVSAHHRLPDHRVLPELPAHPLFGLLRRLPHYFWHNSHCSGRLP